MKVLFYDSKPYDIEWFTKADPEHHFELKFVEYKLNKDTAVMSKGFDAVCAFVNDTIDADAIRVLHENGIRIIAMRCAGYNNVDFKAAYKKIHIVHVKSYSPYAVAEHACALMMALNRKIHRAFNRTRESNFSINGLLGYDLHGKTAGTIGTGQIGRIFGQICKGFGMDVLGYDLRPSANGIFEYAGLEELFSRSDVISLHCPLTRETRHMIDASSIAKMKPGVMLINTSRGGLVDTEALIEGLKERKIGSAGLDVYEEESEYFFQDFSNEIINDDVLARLLSIPNVIVTSHQGFFTREALENIAKTTLKSLISFEEGRQPETEICYCCMPERNECCKKEQHEKCF